MTLPRILALDFDGVICNTVYEGLRSAWQVCREVRGEGGASPPPEVGAAFVRLRPVLEFGWEFPVLLLAILEGIPEPTLLQEFQQTWRQRTLTKYHLTPPVLAKQFDAARDRAIQASLTDWLKEQGLYPGMADRLRATLRDGVQVFVLTTKEGRFAHKLLEINGVTLPLAQVWGKERARPKPDLLRVLRQEQGIEYGDIWFVEDRLKTLQAVEDQADLATVGLFLATWGYLMPGDREEATRDPRIVPLALDQFRQNFSAWLRP
ncbi:MAG TPA: HAD family hydrolase [Candidatus Methylomirabilis sp.]|nr:HAD family hydrolase [Candidatus Methylomirabilis sp.]